jgi:hypothetical protein
LSSPLVDVGARISVCTHTPSNQIFQFGNVLGAVGAGAN